MVSKIEYIGEFYLPKRKKRYSGRIVSNENNSELILEIFGNESLEGNKITQWLSNALEYYNPIILGHANYPQNMTLLECHWHGTKLIYKDLYLIKYKIQTILRHALFSSREHLLLNSIRVCMPHVASWYDGWESHTKIDKVNEDLETIHCLTVKENLTLNFIDSITQRTIIFGKTQETNYQKYIEFKYSEDQHWEKVISDIVRFSRLLEFSFSKPVSFELISATSKSKNLINSDTQFGNSEATLIYFDNFSFVKMQDVYKDDLHQNNMLFSRWVMEKEILNKIIIHWFKTNSFNHIYDLFLDSHNWFEGTGAVLSNVMYNHRVLNLIQGLEDYHRKLMENDEVQKNNYNEIRRKEFDDNKRKILKLLSGDLKKWLNDTLKMKVKESSY